MLSLAERTKNVHPNALKHVRPNADYVSDGLQEYYIKRDHLGYFQIVRYKGGPVVPRLKSSYTTHHRAHEALVGHLRLKNKFKRAIWPDSPKLYEDT